VLSPNGGEALSEAEVCPITWQVNNPSPALDLVEIFLLYRCDGCSPEWQWSKTIASNLPVSQGSYDWQVYVDNHVDSEFKIQLWAHSSTNPTLFFDLDESDGSFFINLYEMPTATHSVTPQGAFTYTPTHTGTVTGTHTPTRTFTPSKTPTNNWTSTSSKTPTITPVPSCGNLHMATVSISGSDINVFVENTNSPSAYLTNAVITWPEHPGMAFDSARFNGDTYYNPSPDLMYSPVTAPASPSIALLGSSSAAFRSRFSGTINMTGLFKFDLTFNIPGLGDCTLSESINVPTPTATRTLTPSRTPSSTFTPAISLTPSFTSVPTDTLEFSLTPTATYTLTRTPTGTPPPICSDC
jgi:hypothetical protein